MSSIENIILFGGSNYQNMTCLVQELAIKNDSFRMNPNPLLHKFKNNREGASLGIMNNSKDS